MRLDKPVTQQPGVGHAIAGREIRINRVTVNGGIVKNSAFKLLPEHDVKYDGDSLVQQNGPRHFILGKPQGYVCSADDPDYLTISYFLDKPVAYRLHTVGRLDIDTAGPVLMTNDGQWSHYITFPRHHYEKTYLVTPESSMTDDTVEQFTHDVQLHNEKDLIKPAVLKVITPTQVRLTTSEGRYHQIKRMFTAMSNHAVELHHERIGDIRLDGDLKPGEHRPLIEKGVASVNLTPR